MADTGHRSYGDGVFRRSVRLWRQPGRVTGALEDDIHAFAVTLDHDGERIIGVDGTAHRYPMSTCPGAIAPLRALVGLALSPDARALGRFTNPRSHCTHWFDLLGLAMAHCYRDAVERHYAVAIPDVIDGVTTARLQVDGHEALALTLDGDRIIAPAPFAGQQISAGFARWVSDTLDGERAEWALILQRARFVSLSRAVDAGLTVGEAAPGRGLPIGVCHTYSEQVLPQARPVIERRDFTNCPEQLLTFADTVDADCAGSAK